MRLARNIVVVGGSYVGLSTAQQLANTLSDQFRVLLVEKNSHFQHLFAFPRFAVTDDVDTHKAFIPYTGAFVNCPPGSGAVVQAKALGLDQKTLQLDRTIVIDGQSVDRIPYEYLVIATGTKLSAPSSLPSTEKHNGYTYLRQHASNVKRSSSIAVLGGGAVGVQIATDIKELYPEKSVTLVHSRNTLMNNFDCRLSEIVVERCNELGVQLKLGSRAKIPIAGYPNGDFGFNVNLVDGSSFTADYVIICTGQIPQSALVESISPECIDEKGFIKTRKTLQIDDPQYPNVFAVGDVADTGAHKAAKPGSKQAALVAKNIQQLLNNNVLHDHEISDNPGIHLTLGITKSVAFGNPVAGSCEPFIKHRDDGRLDMNIDAVWARKNGGKDYYS